LTFAQDKFIQWRNLTLFLAAFGGVTVQEKHDPGALTSAIPPEFLLDDMRSLRDPADLVAIFIEFLTAALVDDVVRVREVAREALGSELSPRLFSKLFRHLDEWVHFYGIVLTNLTKPF
jgi:neurofibromin 1